MSTCCCLSEKIVSYVDLFLRAVAVRVNQQAMVLLDQFPIVHLIGGGLACDDDMLAVLGSLLASIRIGGA